MNQIEIRPMKPDDISEVFEIDRKISGIERAVTYDDPFSSDFGGNLEYSFVADIDGRTIGFILASTAYIGEPAVEEGLIQTIGVDPEYQRKGIATILVNAVMDLSKSRGLDKMRIMLKEKDSQLQPLFSNMGFNRGQLVSYTMVL